MIKKLKNKLKDLYRYIVGLYVMISKPNRYSGKAVYANFSEGEFTKIYGSLAIRAVQAGYKVFIIHNHHFISEYYNRFRGDIMLKWRNIHITFKNMNIPPSSLLFKWADDKPDKIVEITTDILPVLQGEKQLRKGEILYPLDIYLPQFKNRLPIFNIRNNRKIRVGLAGNLNPNHFNNREFNARFAMPNRIEAFEAVKNNFEDQVVIAKKPSDFFPTSHVQILLGGEGYPQFPDAAPRDYLRFLKQTDFFMALPGSRFPHCHSLIEALSMGCIPILSYAHLMPIKLINNVNCLTYQNTQELVSQIEYALSLSANEVKTMRKKAVAYYQKNLSKQFRTNLFNHKIYEVDRMYVVSSD